MDDDISKREQLRQFFAALPDSERRRLLDGFHAGLFRKPPEREIASGTVAWPKPTHTEVDDGLRGSPL